MEKEIHQEIYLRRIDHLRLWPSNAFHQSRVRLRLRLKPCTDRLARAEFLPANSLEFLRYRRYQIPKHSVCPKYDVGERRPWRSDLTLKLTAQRLSKG